MALRQQLLRRLRQPQCMRYRRPRARLTSSTTGSTTADKQYDRSTPDQRLCSLMTHFYSRSVWERVQSAVCPPHWIEPQQTKQRETAPQQSRVAWPSLRPASQPGPAPASLTQRPAAMTQPEPAARSGPGLEMMPVCRQHCSIHQQELLLDVCESCIGEHVLMHFIFQQWQWLGLHS